MDRIKTTANNALVKRVLVLNLKFIAFKPSLPNLFDLAL
jgi:hypothetical protein